MVTRWMNIGIFAIIAVASYFVYAQETTLGFEIRSYSTTLEYAGIFIIILSMIICALRSW